MKILGICGSLRKESRSRALLEAIALRAPQGSAMEIAESIGQLPFFNPDIEAFPTEAVERLFSQVAAADAVIISSPEYAHGVTGVMKNALDWLVGFEPFAYKPTVLLNPSHRAFHADSALRETLVTMNASLIVPACIRIAVTGNHLAAAELAQLEPFAGQIEWVWRAIGDRVAP